VSKPCVLAILAAAGLLRAQEGQGGPKPGWPCIPGRAVDPAYLEISESTGGQLFLFQKSETAHMSVVMGASYSHPATVLRAIGNLNGSRDFDFPVDSSITSLLVLASLQCHNSVQVTRPSGPELTAENSALSVDLQAGRILRVDQPEPGPWRIHLGGSGLFIVSVLAKSDVAIQKVAFSLEGGRSAPLPGVRQDLEAWISGEASNLRFQVVDAAGAGISVAAAMERAGDRTYRGFMTTQAPRFRILVMGRDASGWPFQRMYPVLFHATPPK